MANEGSGYGQAGAGASARIPAPKLDYAPPRPRAYSPNIGLIGAGGITEYHLRAYRTMGLNVVAICDLDSTRATARRDAFYPDADVYTDWTSLLTRDDIEVLDLATPPEARVPIMAAAIDAGKHMLSQKPFVTSLDTGRRLVAMAEDAGVKLAVNQNGRWAPHFAWMLRAVEAGLIGDVASIDFSLHFDHGWTVGTPFEEIDHLLLYDFAVHWFDMSSALMGGVMAQRVFASVQRSAHQLARPPFLGSVTADYDQAQVRIHLNADVVHGQRDRTTIAGSKGTLVASGPELNEQWVNLFTEAGRASPELSGCWFDEGFQGAMGELLCAIEDDREPSNSAAGNLNGLALCFAALKSADTGLPQVPGDVLGV